MQLTDRAVLITGGKRVGASVAEALAARGADVALSYHRSREQVEQAAAAIRAHGRRALTSRADLRQPSACEAVVTAAAQAFGRLDVLIHMASVYAEKPYDELTEQDWDLGLSVDLKAAFLCARAAVPHMRASGGGRIITFSDWVARSGRPRYRGYVPYYVAKVGIIGLTEVLALELAGDNILVNAIAPGPIHAPDDLDDAGRRAVERATPLGRWGGDTEIAKAVVALIETDFMTGETIRVNGGRHVK